MNDEVAAHRQAVREGLRLRLSVGEREGSDLDDLVLMPALLKGFYTFE